MSFAFPQLLPSALRRINSLVLSLILIAPWVIPGIVSFLRIAASGCSLSQLTSVLLELETVCLRTLE
ncbi:hypothetical protein M405DRAFT_558382 [Rhizopogon salebrosus TDB-379]|nr:hypothetical protein M405DRAFT_558382 [Rhizopogon salebrosus TDB-379]